jgi:hypothetical protein
MFPNPWPMGIVFFIGETAGGMILYLDRRRYSSFDRYMKQKQRDEAVKEGLNEDSEEKIA